MRNLAAGLQELRSISDVTFYDLLPMPKRRHINANPSGRSLSSSLAATTSPVREVAWIIEERVVWPGADLFRSLFDAVKWPFEQLGWHFERRLIWPVQERTADWSPAVRIGGALGVVLLLAGIVAAIALPSSSSNSSPVAVPARTAVREPVPTKAAPAEAAPVPVLHGAKPVFAPGSDSVKAPAKPAEAQKAHASAVSPAAAPATPATSVATREVADEEAVTVAREFSDAFVLYETGQVDAEVRSAFRSAATPQLVASLLHRPPRLPANVEVPQAKVLNVVPGPQVGNDCTVSVSLLRVGLSSELRLSLHRDKNGNWLVKDVLG